MLHGLAPFQLPQNFETDGHSAIDLFQKLAEHSAVSPVEFGDGRTAWWVPGHKRIRTYLPKAQLYRDGEAEASLSKLRLLLASVLGPGCLNHVEGTFLDRAFGLLAQVSSGERFDVVSRFSLPLAWFAISEALGVSTEDRQELLDLMLSISPIECRRLIARDAAISQLKMRFSNGYKDYSRSTGGERSRLIRRRSEEFGISSDDLGVLLGLAISAGFEPTANLISTSILHLLENREFTSSISTKPKHILAASRELLRFDSPVFPGIFRRAAESFEIESTEINKGDLLLFPVAVAGRDHAVYPQPNVLSLRQNAALPLAFGVGKNRCPGSWLASHVLSITLHALLANSRWKDLVVISPGPTWSNGDVRALTCLPITGK